MQALIEEAYRLFAPYTVHFPLNICTCECCMPEDCQHELLSYRLREIPADNLAGYLGSVPLADEARHRTRYEAFPAAHFAGLGKRRRCAPHR